MNELTRHLPSCKFQATCALQKARCHAEIGQSTGRSWPGSGAPAAWYSPADARCNGTTRCRYCSRGDGQDFRTGRGWLVLHSLVVGCWDFHQELQTQKNHHPSSGRWFNAAAENFVVRAGARTSSCFRRTATVRVFSILRLAPRTAHATTGIPDDFTFILQIASACEPIMSARVS